MSIENKNEKRRQYYAKNKEKIIKQGKQWRINNKEKVKNNKRRYYLKNREKIKQQWIDNKEIHKEYYLKYWDRYKQYRIYNKKKIKESAVNIIYKITPEKQNELYVKQNGCCAICGIPEDKLNYFLSIDHNHKTKKVRGLLCHTCNRGIGLLKDNINILQKAIDYIKNSK
jgi:hypothetical protein